MTEATHAVIVTDHARLNGGVAKVAIESARGLAAAGLRVTFFAPSGPADPSLHAAGVEVVCLDDADILEDGNRWRAVARGLWNARAARALAKILAAADPRTSVVHCHGFSRALSPAVGPLLTRGPLRHVFTMHEYFLACPNGGFYDYRRNEICTRRALGAACLATNCDGRHATHKAWRLVRQGVLRSVGNLPRGLRDVIYISSTQRRIMAPYLGATTRLHYVRNPVTPVPGPRVPVEANDIFLFVGRITKEKGAVAFARAAAEAGVRAVFVGDGPEAAAVRAANPGAELTGWLDASRTAEWMARARCLVFPSVWYETLGLAPLEALARGVPVICGAWCAAAENVEHGATGMTRESPASLPEALRAMTPERAGEMSRNIAARRHEFSFPVDAHAAQLREVYASVLG